MSAVKMRVTSWSEVALDKSELKSLMRSAGNDVKTKTAKLIAKSSGGGRVYRGGGGSAYRGAYKPGRYRASAAGEPPVAVSGTLRDSLKVYVYPTGEGFAVRERQYYSLFLITGATGGGNPGKRKIAAARRKGRRSFRGVYTSRILLPRPHLDKVMASEAPNIERRVGEALSTGAKWRQTK